MNSVWEQARYIIRQDTRKRRGKGGRGRGINREKGDEEERKQ
jgi:hypothetical protein